MDTPASFSFNPVSVSTTQGELVPVDILIHSDNKSVISADVWIKFDPNILELADDQSNVVTNGDLFQITDVKTITPGTVYLYALNQSKTSQTPANGKIATIILRAKSSGNTLLQFHCVPFDEKASQIIEFDAKLTNIIDCNSTRNHTTEIIVADSSQVLGASSTRFASLKGYVTLAVLIFILIGIFIWRYQKISKEIKKK